jgi:HTH-type transcriptional regulator/antitoxin HigA
MVAFMNSLLDVVGEDEDHSPSGLVELVGDVISTYEQKHHPIEAADPRDCLRFLLEVEPRCGSVMPGLPCGV